MSDFFFDTYAFFELFRGNPRYERYSKRVGVMTTKMNLLELHYGMLRERGQTAADLVYDHYTQFVVDVSDEVIKKASAIKRKFKKRKLSYIDCLGYAIALSYKIPFLTGDRQFHDLPGVEFVK